MIKLKATPYGAPMVHLFRDTVAKRRSEYGQVGYHGTIGVYRDDRMGHGIAVRAV